MDLWLSLLVHEEMLCKKILRSYRNTKVINAFENCAHSDWELISLRQITKCPAPSNKFNNLLNLAISETPNKDMWMQDKYNNKKNVQISAPFFSSINSDFYSLEIPCYFHSVESPTFLPYSKCKKKNPLI